MVIQTRTSRVHRYLRTKVRQDIRAATYSLRQVFVRSKARLLGQPVESNPHLAQLPKTLRVQGLGGLRALAIPLSERESSPLVRARQLHDVTGVYPLSFSYARETVVHSSKTQFLSPTIPGEPYAFDDETEYLAEYERSYFGLSTKKAGWDCFRHLEVMFSGAIPLIPHLDATPPGILFAYPKELLTTVFRALTDGGPAIPSEEVLAVFARHAENHLTTTAMAHYILDSLDYQGGTIAFLDERLHSWTDYQSLFTLIGLKRVLGNRLHTPVLPHYLTAENPETSQLYGRGFGYRGALHRVVSSALQPAVETVVGDSLDGYEKVVLGQFFHDYPLLPDRYRGTCDPARLVGIVGDDYPESKGTLKKMAESPVTFFVRELTAH